MNSDPTLQPIHECILRYLPNSIIYSSKPAKHDGARSTSAITKDILHKDESEINKQLYLIADPFQRIYPTLGWYVYQYMENPNIYLIEVYNASTTQPEAKQSYSNEITAKVDQLLNLINEAIEDQQTILNKSQQAINNLMKSYQNFLAIKEEIIKNPLQTELTAKTFLLSIEATILSLSLPQPTCNK